MEQRVSSLQQRLQARRDLYLNKNNGNMNNTEGNESNALNNGVVSTPSKEPVLKAGQQGGTPASATTSATTPRNVRDALSLLRSNKESNDANAINNSSNANNRLGSTPKVEAVPKTMTTSSTTSTTTPASATKSKPSSRKLDGYVGFANLPNQVYRKSVKRGFEFTLMVVGETGLGKSTLVNSMFLTNIYGPQYPGPSARVKKTVKVDTSQVLLKEGGVQLNLTIVDTPGFGDAVDNSDCWTPILKYIESQYEAFLDAETRINRVQLPDQRVHACLYFIAPTGHGLKPIDVEFMQRLHDKVNIIPVVAKADCLTSEELSDFKARIVRQIEKNSIKIYDFYHSAANIVVEDEKDLRLEQQRLKERVPFAVVGSNCVIENDQGKKTRGRKYPWGVVDIENLSHCDFVPLRNALIRTHLQDLRQVTNDVHYENFRCRKLASVAGHTMDRIPNRNPLALIEEERRDHAEKLRKMEREMEDVFERKVREKQQKLEDTQRDMDTKMAENKENLEARKREMESRREAFLQEKLNWERLNNITIDELKRMSMESLDGHNGKKKKGGGALSGVSFRMGR